MATYPPWPLRRRVRRGRPNPIGRPGDYILTVDEQRALRPFIQSLGLRHCTDFAHVQRLGAKALEQLVYRTKASLPSRANHFVEWVRSMPKRGVGQDSVEMCLRGLGMLDAPDKSKELQEIQHRWNVKVRGDG